ncbi:DUF4271 domain-containing protein [Duncaniella sp.]|uniref:DUF4271 domain-containing protein n=1 Tax=Duncaniella sp. TaxID=2518496 RepID=UPI0023C22DE0|nr:DUF4271 domain-containing protein [Duncaniella sp.]MDE5905207.1 DUF4271 domain-containing protein [Duncaniella sp.]MDE7147760.1 DUF4271 domain-containing protein [Duncaniella sp.]
MNPLSFSQDSVAPFAPQLCRRWEAPVSETAGMTVGTVPYTLGMRPASRTLLPGYDSGVLCLLIAVFLLLAFNLRHCSTYIKNFSYDLWSVRRTDSTFTVRTFSETGIQISIVLLTCLCEGIIINAALTSRGLSTPLATFPEIAAFFVAAGAYYLWQLCAYRVVGYVFTDRLSARQWIKGFNASQALLGLLLTIPALIVLFNPGGAAAVASIGIVCYLIARLIFIFKGFRLFYDNFGSLLYFILYLCTLEIVPVVLIFRCIGRFSQLGA